MADLWSDVTEQPILAIHSGTCADVITESTRCLQQCVQQQLTYLDNRARALATSGNFQRRSIFMMRGLAAVALSDPSRQRLVEAQSMAQECDNTRIDFIKELPLDITMNIAPRILSEEKMAPSEIREYLDVSRVWREKLLICIRQLHVLSTTDDNHLNDNDLLGLIAPYCTALTLKSKVVSLRQFISDARFPSLRALNIVDSYYHSYEDDEEDFGSRDVFDTIVSFRSTATLTHLTISVDDLCDIRFGDILSSCPYLVHLETTTINTNMSSAPTCCPNMKSLSFMLNEDQDFDMDEITKRFPGLERLVASPFYYASDLSIIQNNCPKLKVVGSQNRIGDFPVTSNTDNTPTAGVHTFYVHDYEAHWLDPDHGEMGHVMEFMKRNSHTLQDVSFYTSLPFSGPSDQIGVVDVSNAPLFNRMTSYTQQIYVLQHLRMAKMVAQRSPHLKKFELISASNDDTNAGVFFDDLIGKCKLESVIIRLESFDPLMDMEGIERFIQYHSTIDSQLHTLILPDYVFVSKDALDTLIALPRLKTLGFNWPLVLDEDDSSDDALDDKDGEHAARFIQRLGLGCPQLEHLEISSGYPMPDIIFVQLSKLNIKSLKLATPLGNNTLASLLTLLECPQLQELHIYPPCNTKDPISNHVRRMLKSKIPSVTW
ncbi:hypothetical protein O0I10_011466 [Lichtheimia ornata]|uniref:F-box domain-containing protein n=1 Tax=Lichtheimia ornata TaxID=688661 RepID=A0AAD7XU30_9FUNG|nr:uncharacterized protein O0I10_011466 [Lichtheimia ornata]KAJ8652866.1 hypothetical protein O0I10_011466 [Lichtheimia ornata]